MHQKYELGTRLTYFWHKKEKKISLNFSFVFEPLHFQHTCSSFLLSKFASERKLIQSVVRVRIIGICVTSSVLRVLLSDSGSQGRKSKVPGTQLRGPGCQSPSSRILGVRVPCFRVLKSQVPESCVIGLRVSSLRVPGPGSQVLILDYATKIATPPPLQDFDAANCRLLIQKVCFYWDFHH